MEDKNKTLLKPTLQIHSQLVSQELSESENMSNTSMKAVDVKLLDLDWIFQDGNGRRLVWLLSLTSHEALFSTK